MPAQRKPGAAESPPPWRDIGADSSVIVGVSGGVDSAVSLTLLKQAGFSVRAVFMKNWEEDDDENYCAAAEDLEDARRVCERLGVTLHTVNLSAEYWDNVFSRFLEVYRRGETPNPDVLCNREIKFRAFLDFATDLGADVIATGHYARIEASNGRYRLLKGRDQLKDQSYFLCLLHQSQLERAVFPLGALAKGEVRQLARRFGLHNHARKDSTGVCFIGERPFKSFLERYIPRNPGPILSVEGHRLGSHDGLMFYTIGQRQGLGIGGRRHGDGSAWYVAAKDSQRNALLVAQGREHPALYADSLEAGEVHWISGFPPALPLRCQAKIRFRQPEQACSVEPAFGGRVLVRFRQAQWAAAPGQTVAFYSGEECLGGATICKAPAGRSV
jgi:tRNA-specific 2-thiouridylase